jgi:hypothetical protein
MDKDQYRNVLAGFKSLAWCGDGQVQAVELILDGLFKGGISTGRWRRPV